jgi:hypothetical protein
MNKPKRRLVRASEIGQYVFCAKSWHLSNIIGVASHNTREMEQGTQVHEQHGQRLALASSLRYVAIAFGIIALIALALALR